MSNRMNYSLFKVEELSGGIKYIKTIKGFKWVQALIFEKELCPFFSYSDPEVKYLQV